MKNFQYILILSALLIAGCSKMEENAPKWEEERVRINFSVLSVPYEKLTRSGDGDGQIHSLQLWVFDENGGFIEADMARKDGNGHFSVLLPASFRKRIIHFVANYELDRNTMMQWRGKSEREVVPALELRDGKYCLWAREVYDQGLMEGSDLGQIRLVRNYVKYRLKIEGGTAKLTDVEYKLCRVPDRGTVAPFDGDSGNFDLSAVAEQPNSVLTSGEDFVPLSQPLYSYEKKNSNITQQKEVASMLVRGHYNGRSEWSYYKIDFVCSHDGSRRYDLRRNHCMSVKITEIRDAGYASEEDAVNGAPSNNMSFSAEMLEFPSFWDGKRLLKVERTFFSFPNTATDASFRVDFYPDASELRYTENEKIRVRVVENSHGRVGEGVIAASCENGVVSLKMKNTSEDILTDYVIVQVEGQPDMNRLVRIEMRPYYKYQRLEVTTDSLGESYDSAQSDGERARIAIPEGQGNTLSLSVKLPEEFSERLLPMTFCFRSDTFYPAYDDNKMMIGMENGKMVYKLKVKSMPEDRVLNFKFQSNRVNSEGLFTMEVLENYFKKQTIEVYNR